MEIQFVIVRSENAEYLCHNVNGTYVDVSDPSTEFVSGEDEFRLGFICKKMNKKLYKKNPCLCTLFPGYMLL